jgi:hypothetical protein
LGRRSLISSFTCWLSQELASYARKCGKIVAFFLDKDVEEPEKSAECSANVPTCSPILLTPVLLSFFHLSFSFLNLCYFDEPTQPGVTMTGSRTECVSSKAWKSHDGGDYFSNQREE